MNVPNYLFLKPLEDFFLNTNQKEIELKFFESFLDELGQIPAGSSFGKDGVWENGTTYLLKDKIFEEYLKIYDKIIIDIDIIMISIEDKTKLLKYIETTLKYLISNYAYFLKNHPKIKSSLEVNFKKYFLSKYNLQLYLKKEKFVSNSIFNYKYSESVLKKLYQISITDSLIFDIENVDEDMFIKVFSNKDTNLNLKFNCSSTLMVGYLDAISVLFKNLNETSIDKSRKFYTKSGSLLTYNNYQTNRNRFLKNPNNKKLLEKITEFAVNQLGKSK